MSEKKDITVEAELEVRSPLGTQKVRTFARAWRTTLEEPMPAGGRFIGWARIEKKGK